MQATTASCNWPLSWASSACDSIAMMIRSSSVQFNNTNNLIHTAIPRRATRPLPVTTRTAMLGWNTVTWWGAPTIRLCTRRHVNKAGILFLRRREFDPTACLPLIFESCPSPSHRLASRFPKVSASSPGPLVKSPPSHLHVMASPTTLKEFESVWPRIVADIENHCKHYKLPKQSLDWFVLNWQYDT